MTVLYRVEPQNPPKKCKFIFSCLKDSFSNCHAITGSLSTEIPREEKHPTSDIDENGEDEEEVVVSAIRSGALEKLRKKPILMVSESFTWVYSPATKQLYVKPKALDQNKDAKDIKEEFLSAKSCFSCCSSDASRDAFLSAKTSFSRSSSLNNGGGFVVDLNELRRQTVIQELCHCEGWPFGLCRRAILLPPLPKSPSESWLWRKDTKTQSLKLTY